MKCPTVPIPPRMRKLPQDSRGYPIPVFLDRGDGTSNFKEMNREVVLSNLRHRRCNICGSRMGARIVFVGGPKSCENSSFGDPPFHRECALYAAKVCPYILIGGWDRSKGRDAEAWKELAPDADLGPKVNYLYETRSFELSRIHGGTGALFFAGPRIGSLVRLTPATEGT